MILSRNKANTYARFNVVVSIRIIVIEGTAHELCCSGCITMWYVAQCCVVYIQISLIEKSQITIIFWNLSFINDGRWIGLINLSVNFIQGSNYGIVFFLSTFNRSSSSILRYNCFSLLFYDFSNVSLCWDSFELSKLFL